MMPLIAMKRISLVSASLLLCVGLSIRIEAGEDTREHDHNNFKIEWKNRADALRIKNDELACRHGANVKSFLDRYSGQFKLDPVSMMHQRQYSGNCERLGYVFEPTIKAGDLNAFAKPANYVIDEGPDRNYFTEEDYKSKFAHKEIAAYRKATMGSTNDPRQACIHALNIMEIARKFPLNVASTVKMEYKYAVRRCKRDYPGLAPDIVFLP